MHGECRCWHQRPQQNAEDTATHYLETELSVKIWRSAISTKRNMMVWQLIAGKEASKTALGTF